MIELKSRNTSYLWFYKLLWTENILPPKTFLSPPSYNRKRTKVHTLALFLTILESFLRALKISLTLDLKIHYNQLIKSILSHLKTLMRTSPLKKNIRTNSYFKVVWATRSQHSSITHTTVKFPPLNSYRLKKNLSLPSFN